MPTNQRNIYSNKTYSRWQDAQALLHAEAHSLIKAFEDNGSLPKKVIIFVDRETCTFCTSQMPSILKAMGIEEVKLIQWKSSRGLLLKSTTIPANP
jgi:deoxycytidylate deaminase